MVASPYIELDQVTQGGCRCGAGRFADGDGEDLLLMRFCLTAWRRAAQGANVAGVRGASQGLAEGHGLCHADITVLPREAALRGEGLEGMRRTRTGCVLCRPCGSIPQLRPCHPHVALVDGDLPALLVCSAGGRRGDAIA